MLSLQLLTFIHSRSSISTHVLYNEKIGETCTVTFPTTSTESGTDSMSILGGPEGDTLKKDHVITWPTRRGNGNAHWSWIFGGSTCLDPHGSTKHYILLMEEKSANLLMLIIYLYKVLYNPGGAGFLPSTVWLSRGRMVQCYNDTMVLTDLEKRIKNLHE